MNIPLDKVASVRVCFGECFYFCVLVYSYIRAYNDRHTYLFTGRSFMYFSAVDILDKIAAALVRMYARVCICV